ncbi:MAG: DUF5808 domain-containing protein [Sarcina sp.]
MSNILIIAEMLFVLIILWICQLYFPIKGRNGILLSCVVEEDEKQTTYKKIINKYKLIITLLFFLFAILELIVVFFNLIQFSIIPLLGYLVLSTVPLVFYRSKIRAIKASQNKDTIKKQVSIVDLERTKISSLSIITYILVAIIFIGINIITYIKSTAISSNQNSLFSTFIATIILVIAYILSDIMIRKMTMKIDPKNPEDSKIQNTKAKNLLSLLLFFTIIPELVTISFINTIPMNLIANNIIIAISSIMQIVVIIGIIVFSIMISKVRNKYKVTDNSVTFKDDDSYWKLGIIYYNKNNPSVFVEKRSGMGVTINAGTTGGMIFFIITGILILFAIIVPFIH